MDDIEHAARLYLQAATRARRWPSQLSRLVLASARRQLLAALALAER